MEKLIELLNEYNRNVLKWSDKWKEKSWKLILQIDYNHSRSFNSDLYICSLRYWFIKWLVDNEKIDYEKVRKWEWNGGKWHFETVQPEYYIIMLLSIQDEPIEFLISILKNV